MEVPIGLKKSAVLCIVKNKNKLLLLRRNKELHLNKYIPSGGHIEPFETPLEAAKREIKEEIGLVVNDLNFCGVMVETSPTKFNWVNFIYSVEVDWFNPPTCKEGILEWVEVSHININEIPTPTTDKYIYKYVLDDRKFMFNAVWNESIELVLLQDEMENRLLYKK